MNENMKKLAGYIIALVTLAAAAYGLTSVLWLPASVSMLGYENAQYGITFSYPDSYSIDGREVGNGERGHFAITLIAKKDKARVPTGGEGPPAITIDIYQNNLDKLSVENWIRNTSASNFKLSLNGKLTPIVAAGVKGFYYQWDGLYRGESTVIAHEGNILVFTATYLDAGDQIRTDFGQILSSVVLN